MQITDMMVNHLERPMGCPTETPVFSWRVQCKTGRRSACVRFRLGTDETLNEPLLDTGARENISSLGFRPEIELQPMTRYYWQVQVTADSGECAWSAVEQFETGRGDVPWQAKWIRAPYAPEKHPVLVRRFNVSGELRRARIYICGLGLYEAYLNGEKLGRDVLAPFYTDYEFQIQVQTYALEELLHPGENTLEVWLGRGWYQGRFGGFIPEMEGLYGAHMQLIAELRLDYADGSGSVIGTDEDWLCRPSPVLASGIYDGEVLDARLWNAPEDAHAIAAEPPVGALTDRISPPLCVQDRMCAQRCFRDGNGDWVLDFGQNLSGWVEFDCDLPAGREIELRFGEVLQDACFYQGNLGSAEQRFVYISDGQRRHVRPHFTYFGFRYARVRGLDAPQAADFTACVISSALKPLGRIETSHAGLNQLFHNAWWGQMDNFLDVPTDCPQRAERLGWTGDAQVFAATASYNRYTPAFYEKFLSDMRLEQRSLGGAVPFTVPDTMGRILRILDAPHPRFRRITGRDGEKQIAYGSCAWGDAATVIPMTLYSFYGDRHLLEKQYENMKLWTDWICAQDDADGSPRLWRTGFHFADWLALDNPIPGNNFGGTENAFVASAYYYLSLCNTAEAARALELHEDAGFYARRAEEVCAAFRKEYFTQTGRIAVPTQTAMVLALHLNLVPAEHRARLCADLRERFRLRGDHLDTGFVGSYYICPALTENGMNDLAYTLLLNEDCPSWLYPVRMGATTIWERWNSLLPDGRVSSTGMNSLNHYAYGAIVEWMYRDMCGLAPDPQHPGFRRARLCPHPDARVEWVSAEYESASGRYAARWRIVPEGVEYEYEIPFDGEGLFVPPDVRGSWMLDGAPLKPDAAGTVLDPGMHRLFQRLA